MNADPLHLCRRADTIVCMLCILEFFQHITCVAVRQDAQRSCRLYVPLHSCESDELQGYFQSLFICRLGSPMPWSLRRTKRMMSGVKGRRSAIKERRRSVSASRTSMQPGPARCGPRLSVRGPSLAKIPTHTGHCRSCNAHATLVKLPDSICWEWRAHSQTCCAPEVVCWPTSAEKPAEKSWTEMPAWRKPVTQAQIEKSSVFTHAGVSK